LHDNVAALEMNGLGVVELQPNLAVVHYSVVGGVGSMSSLGSPSDPVKKVSRPFGRLFRQ